MRLLLGFSNYVLSFFGYSSISNGSRAEQGCLQGGRHPKTIGNGH
jgi:hypothetical protein